MSLKTDLKIILIGNSNSGKTQFVNKWTKDIFRDIYRETIVSEFVYKDIWKNEKQYAIQIWDISGSDENNRISKIFAKDAHGCIIMSDATKIEKREE